MLFLLSPFFLGTIIILRLTGEGHIVFKQKRVGKCFREFNVYKFATMLANSPNIGTGTVTIKDDPRILPVGRFLRKSKFNELPQIFNILIGDMTFVGPRPQAKYNFEKYSTEAQLIISSVRPGITGLGSIVFRDEELWLTKGDFGNALYGNLIMPYKASLEIWYIENKNIMLDLKLILITAWVVCFPNSGLIWSQFKSMPEPPAALREFLNLNENS